MDKIEVEAIQRKALKGKSGVYAIFNEQAGKIYIGSSNDIWKRWEEHKRKLRANRHHCHHLQNSWNKYGEREFSFVIVEFCDTEIRLEREQYYLDMYKDKDKRDLIYNETLNATAPMEGLKHSEESKKKISKATKGKVNPMYGKHHSEEIRKKISEINKGKNLSSDNPNSKELYIYNKNGLVNKFDTMEDGAKWLINNGYINSNNKNIIHTTVTRINESIKGKKPYRSFIFSHILIDSNEINNIYKNDNSIHTDGVYMRDNNDNKYYFKKLKDCAKYLLDNKIIVSKSQDLIGNACRMIISRIKSGKDLKGYYFSYKEINEVS